jgi:hypothetical protein
LIWGQARQRTIILTSTFKLLKPAITPETTYRAASILTAKETGPILISLSGFKVISMCTGVRAQAKIEDPTLIGGKHILMSFCWQNLQMVPFLEDITVSHLASYYPKRYRAAFLTLKTAIFVIHFKLT